MDTDYDKFIKALRSALNNLYAPDQLRRNPLTELLGISSRIDAPAALQKALSREVKFDELPRFPGISRDVALEVAADVPHSKFEDFFAGLKEPLLSSATLFDVFSDPTGAKLAAGRKSVA